MSFATRNANVRIYFERRYGLNLEKFSLDCGESAPDEGGSESDTFAENGPDASKAAGNSEVADGTPTDHQDLLDQLVEAVLPEAARQNRAFMDKLPGLIEKAESFQDIQLLLAKHLGRDLDMQEQEDLLADLMAASDLIGRAAAKEEA
jgi:phage gp29-like protein